MNAIFRSILDFISSAVGSHGLAVILFTLLIRLVLVPFDFKSRKSMRRMEKVNPQLQALQKKYANDKEKLQKKQAELYKKEKINPLGSCLPMLLTLPVFFIMFSAMRGAANERLVESMLTLQRAVGDLPLANADAIRVALPSLNTLVEPFLWIKNLWMADSPFTTVLPLSAQDLSAITAAIEGVISADELTALKLFIDGDIYQQIILPHYGATPLAGATVNLLLFQLTVYQLPNGFFILPVLSFVSQFFTNSLNPQAQSQQQGAAGSGAFMKWFFPIFSLWICSTSNAAFALYWVVTNVVSMAQQVGFKMYFDAQDRKTTALAKEVSL